MKLRLLQILALFFVAVFGAAAQDYDYDDIYYNSSKGTAENEKESTETASANVVDYDLDDQESDGWHSTIIDMRDVDEYNRRGSYVMQEYDDCDTVYVDTTLVDSDSFQYTERIRRFHNADVIADCEDEDAVNLYVYTRPDVNIIVGTPATTYVGLWGTALWGWGVGLSWYDPWYDPWYYDPWYYYPYWYYTSWYRPYWGWGWGYHYAHHHHYHDWWHPVQPMNYTRGGRQLYADAGRRGMSANGMRATSVNNRRLATTGAGSGTARKAVSNSSMATNTQRQQQGVATNGRISSNSEAINRYKARVNRMSAATSSNSSTDNRVATSSANRLNAANNSSNRINRTTTSRKQTTSVKNTTTTEKRSNQLNRRSTANRSATSLGTSQSGYRTTSRGTSYYRSGNSTSTSNATSRYRSATTRSATNYNKSGNSSYRSSSRSSGTMRSSSGTRGDGGGGRSGGGRR